MSKKFRVLTPFIGGGGVALRLLTVFSVMLPCGVSFAEEESEKSNVDIRNYLESEDYIFTAERIPTNRWDTPANVHVITSEEIERNHYQSVDEALRHVNGVVVTEGLGIFHSESASGIGTHMVGNNRVLILIDGRRFFDPQSEKQEAKAFTGIPSIKMVDRIEIVKGGNSALYGSDAFSGVINIITKKGTRNETTIDLNTGTWSRHKYEITNQGVVNKFGWFVTGKFDESGYWDYKNNSSGYGSFNEVDEYENSNFSVRLDQRFTDSNSMTLDYAHVSGDWALHDDGHNNKLDNVALSYNFKEGTTTPSWLRYVMNNYSKTAPGTGKPHSRLQGLEYQNGWEMGQHKIIAGLEYHKNHAVYPLFDYDVNLTTKSIYFQDTISLGDKWKFIPGARYDHHTQFGGNLSPKVATNYRADEKTKFYLTWGRSYNSPLSSELYSKKNPTNPINQLILALGDTDLRIRNGNENLEPEKGYSFIGGFEHDFNEKSGMTLSLFQNKLNNYLDWDVSRSNIFVDVERIFLDAQNHIPIKSRGLELTFGQKMDDHFSYNLGYSYTHSSYEHQTLGDVTLHRPQQNGYRVGLNYSNRGLKSSLLGVMASGLFTDIGQLWLNTDTLDSYTTKKYAVLDFNLSYDFNEHATFYFKALNLTNQCYSDYTSEYLRYDYKDIYGNDRYDYAKCVHHSPGRSFIFGATYRF